MQNRPFAQQDEIAWQKELAVFGRNSALVGVLLASVFYSGVSSLLYSLNDSIHIHIHILYVLIAPAAIMLPCYLMTRIYNWHPLVIQYVILFSLSTAEAYQTSFLFVPNQSLIAIGQFPIFVTFGLTALWHYKHSIISLVYIFTIHAVLFVSLTHNSFLDWFSRWGILFPVAFGMMGLILFRYNTMRKNFILTQEVNRSKISLEEKNLDITASINYALRIQRAILPTEETIKQLLPNSFIFYKPKDIVSGDFYFLEQRQDKLILAVADCTGHGVPGAFVSMLGINLLTQITETITSPHLILAELNKGIEKTLKQSQNKVRDGMDITIVCLQNEVSSNNTQPCYLNSLEFSGAMNNFYAVKIHKKDNTFKEFIEIKGTKLPIGGGHYSPKRESNKTFTTHTVLWDKETEILNFFLCSDGYQDQFGGEHHRKFMTKNLKLLFQHIAILPTQEQFEYVKNTFDQWKGNHAQLDDVLVIGVKL